jgi:hypothetical protein
VHAHVEAALREQRAGIDQVEQAFFGSMRDTLAISNVPPAGARAPAGGRKRAPSTPFGFTRILSAIAGPPIGSPRTLWLVATARSASSSRSGLRLSKPREEGGAARGAAGPGEVGRTRSRLYQRRRNPA